MHTKRRSFGVLLFVIWTISVILFSNLGLILAADENKDKYLANGEWIKYSWTTREAYIPYAASSIYVEVVDISDPDNITINVGRGWDSDTNELTDILNESIAASFYILNNDSLTYDRDNCPGNIGNPSEIRNHWTSTYLLNVTETYYDVPRTAVQLQYTQTDVELFNGTGYETYDISTRWVWDKKTGVLLNNSVTFNNKDNPELSGYVEQYVEETSIWSLDTGGGIPGFPLDYLIPTILIGMLLVVVKVKRTQRRMTQ